MGINYKKILVIITVFFVVFGGYYFLYFYHPGNQRQIPSTSVQTQMNHREKVLYYCNFTIFENLYLNIYGGKQCVNNTTFYMPNNTTGFAYCIHSNDTPACVNMGPIGKMPSNNLCIPNETNSVRGGTAIVSASGLYFLAYFNAIKSGIFHIILYSSKTFTGNLYFDK